MKAKSFVEGRFVVDCDGDRLPLDGQLLIVVDAEDPHNVQVSVAWRRETWHSWERPVEAVHR